ncbi:hypothetical protein [Demequina sp. NBRC 110054]|uniref:hypothetical protein n=1 Tax=Demequina sp. NBRC 110054 TaxID=1570343 RepID=UPI001177DAB0|nr:hypothetical protein [Demequina sp. NBRC 110054]
MDTTRLEDTVRLRDALAGSTAVMVVTDGQDTPLSASTAHGLSDVLDDMIRRARPDMGRADRY